MAERLPEGLVASNTDVVSEGIERHDRVNVDDLARLWRAYATNRLLLTNDIGRRLENFFWRIWGSRRIRERLSGSRVALLFQLISEGEIIRTTPIPSPRSSRMIPRTSSEQQLTLPESPKDERQSSDNTRSKRATGSPSSSARPGLLSKEEKISGNTRSTRVRGSSSSSDATGPPSVEEEKGRRRSSSRPPPILKRPGIESGGSRKTATILTPAWKTGASDPDHDEAEETSPKVEGLSPTSAVGAVGTTSHGTSVSPTSPQDPRPGNIAKAKKKASFVVGGSSTKRRPAMNRRKSSQSSSGGNSKATSPKPPTGFPSSSKRIVPPLSPSTESRSSPRGAERPTSRSVSPQSSSPFKRPPRDHMPIGDVARNPAPAQQDWLVDRNFRSSFVDKVRTQGSIGTKSPAATSLSTSFQARGSSFGSREEDKGKGKGKGKAKATDVEEDLPSLSLKKLPSQVLDEQDEPTELGGLPRVKSQLSMLLQESKDKKGESSSKGKGKKGRKGA